MLNNSGQAGTCRDDVLLQTVISEFDSQIAVFLRKMSMLHDHINVIVEYMTEDVSKRTRYSASDYF